MEGDTVITTQFKMSEEDKKILEALEGSIVNGEKALEGLEAAGMNVDVLRTELKVARERRDALLTYFG